MPFHVGLFKLTKDILAGKLFSTKIFINSFILNAKELAKVQNVLFETLQCLKMLRLSKRYSYLFDIVQSYIKNESRRQMSQNILWKLFTAWKLSVFEVILVRIFLHSDWIHPLFSPNAGKYGPELLQKGTHLHSVWFLNSYRIGNIKKFSLFFMMNFAFVGFQGAAILQEDSIP